MTQAIEIAERALYTARPNPRVGCVLVRDGEVIGEGWHRRAGEAHAEVNALVDAMRRAKVAGAEKLPGEKQDGFEQIGGFEQIRNLLRSSGAARGATAYVSLEPCSHHGRTPPCAQMLCDAGVSRVVAAIGDPNPQVSGRGLAQLQAAGIATESGLMQDRALALNLGFHKRMREGRPYVRVKVAASLDGRTALANGESQWITGPSARRDVQHWRAQSCAILTGVGTVIADNPRLNLRESELGDQVNRFAQGLGFAEIPSPLRVVLDSKGRIPSDSIVLSGPEPSLIISTKKSPESLCENPSSPVQTSTVQTSPVQTSTVQTEVVAPAAPFGVALDQVLDLLGQLSLNEVHVEAGAILSGALISAGLADELLLYLAPSLLGPQARPLLELPLLRRLEERRQLQIDDVTQVGEDLRLRLRLLS